MSDEPSETHCDRGSGRVRRDGESVRLGKAGAEKVFTDGSQPSGENEEIFPWDCEDLERHCPAGRPSRYSCLRFVGRTTRDIAMDVPVHGKSWQIPRPSLWWKSRPSGEEDPEIGAEDSGRYKTHRESVSSVHNQYGGESYYGYAASNASTSSSSSSNNTPVGSLNSPLVRVQSSRPAWLPTALPPLALDGGLKKGELEIATVGADHIPKKEEDTQSIASSTHFTVVGGYGGGGRVHGGEWRLKAGKITALVLSMSLLILVGILAAILFLEVRARNMKGHMLT